jgi:3-deoxy-D-manno-octulosonic acid kinase
MNNAKEDNISYKGKNPPLKLSGLRADTFLPYGFIKIEKGDTNHYIRRGLEDFLLSSELFINGGDSLSKDVAEPLKSGRGTAFRISIKDVENVIVRRYRHGGLFGKIFRDRYFIGHRALEELFCLTTASIRGVPVPEALGVSERRRRFWFIPSPFYTAQIATTEIADSINLPEFLNGVDDTKLRGEVLLRAGAAIKKMHDAGIHHKDLNMNNLLVKTVDDAIFIIDFDRAKIFPLLTDRFRLKSLRRLLRSARKLARLGDSINDNDFLHILTGYAGDNTALIGRLKRKTLYSKVIKFRSLFGRIRDGLLH